MILQRFPRATVGSGVGEVHQLVIGGFKMLN
jgi:hypothetical protein